MELIFTGDIMLSRNVGGVLKSDPGFSILDENLLQDFNNADLVIGNLECPVSEKSAKYKPGAFRAHPDTLSELQPFDFVSIANNHIFDCGTEGVRDTIENLRAANVKFGGIVKKGETKWEPTVIEIGGKTLAFIACLDFNCLGNFKKDSSFEPLVAFGNEVEKVINWSKENCDFVFVFLHGGDEMIPYPSPKFRKLCQNFIDNGASFVITHHPHVLGGMENYQNGMIFYSLGDFIFDGESNFRRRSGYLKISLDKTQVEWELIPTEIEKTLAVKKAGTKNANRVSKKYTSVSRSLEKKNYNSLHKLRYWLSFITFQADRFFFQMRHKGIFYSLKAFKDRIKLLPFYFKKLIAGEHK